MKSTVRVVEMHSQDFQTKVVQSKGWLSIGRMDALHRNYKARSKFQGAWRGIESEATPSPLEVINKNAGPIWFSFTVKLLKGL